MTLDNLIPLARGIFTGELKLTYQSFLNYRCKIADYIVKYIKYIFNVR